MKETNWHRKWRILCYTGVAALGGFLFGFDTAVISGAEQAVQRIWNLGVFEHGFTISIALLGTVAGALLGGYPSDRLGRKYTLFWVGVLFWISAVGSALATDWYLFLFFRLVGGLAVGVSSVAAPLYISEIAPPGARGKLVALFQFNVVFGILAAFFSNYLLAGLSDMDWRWMLGVEAIPAFIFLLAVLFIPNSPRWLIVRFGRVNEARDILETIRRTEEIEAEIHTIQAGASGAPPQEPLIQVKYRTQLLLVLAIAMFNQLSGINAIIYYAPRILEMAGFAKDSAMLSTVGIGVINLLATLLALFFIDRIGRRFLMTVGSYGLIITLLLVARAFYVGQYQGISLFLFLYIAFFAFSQGAVIWVFISEIFPNSVRARGQALGSFTHWLLAAFIAFLFPYFTRTLGPGHTFMVFAAIMLLQLLFVRKMMPETKGKTLEEIGEPLPVLADRSESKIQKQTI